MMTSSEAAGRSLELGTAGGGQIVKKRAGEGGQETSVAELAAKRSRSRRKQAYKVRQWAGVRSLRSAGKIIAW